MAEDQVSIDAGGLERFGGRAVTGLARLGGEIDDVLTLYAMRLRQHAEGRFSREYSPGASRTRSYLQNRSGAGRRSFIFEVTGDGANTRLVFATTQPYVAAHEFGATVRPVQASYLTIPMEDNLNPSGEPYLTASEAISQGAFFHRADTGGLFIVQEEGGVLEFLFWLTEGPVEIPPRLGLGEYVERPAVQDQLLADVVRAITGVVAEVLR